MPPQAATPPASEPTSPLGPRLGRAMRVFAWIDLPVVACLALPGLAPGFVAVLGWLDRLPGLGTVMPVIDPLAWLLIHVGGVLGVMWALLRLWQPNRAVVMLDIAGRIAVIVLIAWALMAGVTPVALLFVITELAGAAVQGALLRTADAAPSSTAGALGTRS